MVWRIDGPQCNESSKIKYDIVQYTRGKGLDLGCGGFKAFPHFIGVDSGHQWGKAQADIVSECDKLELFASDGLDFVFSSHLLEHIVNTEAALKEWFRVIKPSGNLVLYLPHKDFYPNVGQPGANPDHKHDFLPSDIIEVMEKVGGWDLLVNEERNEGIEYSFLQVYRKRSDEQQNLSYLKPKPTKTACVVRYGGFGDQIQASSILPQLKKLGYHVTFMTTPKGYDVVKADPHIDEFFIQDSDQVQNEELHQFWAAVAKKFDKFINLSESVEGTLLATPGRANHAWPDSVRRKMLNKNYLEFTHDIAELPYKSSAKFYPTSEEIAWAEDYINKTCGDSFVILWPLSGSSIHKFYPWQDQVIARVMLELPQAKFILTGDYSCKILEGGWEEEARVILTSGELSIRQTLTLSQMADCVVGPETGVLNAVAFEPTVKKIIMLSHSTHENLTKHWENTDAIEPDKSIAPCYPCHRLHYGTQYCHEHIETGAAMCAASIDPERIFKSIKNQYNRKRKKAA